MTPPAARMPSSSAPAWPPSTALRRTRLRIRAASVPSDDVRGCEWDKGGGGPAIAGARWRVIDDEAVRQFWDAFVAATGTLGAYTAWGFGDESDPTLMTDLGLLVRDGPKRATTTIAAALAADGEPIPAIGDHSVVLDGRGLPLCIIRTTAVETRRFGEVDAAFAWDEGEGDRTLPGWRAAHLRFFESIGTPVDDATTVVLERFVKVWPSPVDSDD